MNDRYIATVDLGTSKTALSVARIEGKNAEVLYYRETPSDGIRYSCVFNPKRASEVLKTAICSAEDELGIKIEQVVTTLPRYSVIQESRSAKIERSDPDNCIEPEEIDTLKNIARDDYPLSDPLKEEIYGAVAQSFNTDDSINLPEFDVVGSSSVKLEGNFKIFIGAKKAIHNIDSILNTLGIASARKCFIPDAIGRAVLNEEEKDNGVALIEIGAGVSSVSIYQKGILRFYQSIPFGGRNVTSDIKYECGFKEALCENIKLGFGACLPECLQNMSEKIIQVNYDEEGTNRQITVKYLSEIISARMKEIYEALLFIIQESGYAERLRSGIVLTGGGANLANAGKMLEKMSGYSVRIGFPRCKNMSVSVCPEICEPSAAASVAMLLMTKDDEHLNCTSKVKHIVKEKVVEETTETEDTVFNPAVDENTEKTAVEKKKKPRITWGDKIAKFGKDTFNNTMGSLFDNV